MEKLLFVVDLRLYLRLGFNEFNVDIDGFVVADDGNGYRVTRLVFTDSLG